MYISFDELQTRCRKIMDALLPLGVESLLIRSIPNHIYLTGSVFSGFTFLHRESLPLFFYDRPTHLFDEYGSERAFPIRKPEDIPPLLAERGMEVGQNTAVELSYLTQTEYARLCALSSSRSLSCVDASVVMRTVRSVKTEKELAEIREIAGTHMQIYRIAPSLWKKGMTDLEWQYEIEHFMRQMGSIGIFRTFGTRMEIFMGNLCVGANADNVSPYDFAMGGGGTPSMPMSANGTLIRKGDPLMLDMAGNFGRYTTDITRVYAYGKLAPHLQRAHDLSVELQQWFASTVREGVSTSEIYQFCMDKVRLEGLADHFMGMSYQAKFVGHGIGIEINELPVLTKRAPVLLQAGMVLAFEPKFVFPDGAVGVENTFEITPERAVNLSPIPMEVIPLED